MLIFRYGKIIRFIPAFEISIGRPSFYKGVQLHLVFWSRGISLTVTTKKIYAEFKEKERKVIEERKRQLNDKTGQEA